MKSRIMLLFILILILTGCGNKTDAENDDEMKTADELEITVFSIGKADSILIRFNGRSVLIDTGESDDADYILSALEDKNIESLDLLLITHFDKDHVGSAARICERLSPASILYPDYEGSRKEYTAFMQAIEGNESARAVTQEERFDLGVDGFVIYPAINRDEIVSGDDPDNDMSLVVRLIYKNTGFVFAGDVEKNRIEDILESGIDLSCDWLKMPHHGKYQKKVKDFIDLCSPQIAVITDSDEEPAGEKTLAYLEELGVIVYNTREGDIVTRSDGENIYIK